MPVIFKHTRPLFGVWKIEETSDELLSMLALRSEYLPFLQNIKTEKRRQEWLASRVLLKELSGSELLIAYHEDGAPYLPDSAYHLSISHTNGYAAVLLQEQPAAGIDIEYYSTRILKIRSRFMSPEEDASVECSEAPARLLVRQGSPVQDDPAARRRLYRTSAYRTFYLCGLQTNQSL
jgi:4'-phosphopantetheinyl transferase